MTSTFAILVVLCAVAAVSAAGQNPWELVRETDDGIAVYMRETPGTTVRIVKATCMVPAPPEIVLDAAADPNTFRDSGKYIAAAKLQYTPNPNVWYLYQRVAFPVISERDYALRYERRVDKTSNVYRLMWKTTSEFGPPPQEDIIRVTLAEGFIAVAPVPGRNDVKVTYYLHADPGGSIPGWVINLAQKNTLPAIMRELRDESVRRARRSAQK